MTYTVDGLELLWQEIQSHSAVRQNWITQCDNDLKRAEDDRMQMVSTFTCINYIDRKLVVFVFSQIFLGSSWFICKMHELLMVLEKNPSLLQRQPSIFPQWQTKG